MSAMDRGERGREIALLLWPTLKFLPGGTNADRWGVDGLDGFDTVQVKYDRRIVTSGNLYHEIYEKTANRPWQPWRKSPGTATVYIFTTETTARVMGFKVTVDALASAEAGQTLKPISPNKGAVTSMGFIIPLHKIPHEKRQRAREGTGQALQEAFPKPARAG